MSSDNMAVVNGTREFYSNAAREMGQRWPDFDSLTREQVMAWMRAYGATVMVSAEMSAAFVAMGV